MDQPKKWRYGVNRWFVLLFIILSVVAASKFPPVLPHIQLPAEPITPVINLPVIGNFAITNTMVAMVIADVLILLLALAVRGTVSKALPSSDPRSLVPSGFAGAVEALLEALYNLTETTAGRRARQIFPYFVAITLFVLIVNWTELIPGVDSIGLLHQAEGKGNAIQELAPGVAAIVKGEGEYGIIPFVRVLSTDLNFTVALALVSVIMTQIFGVQAQGGNYFTKFWNVKTIFSKPIFGVIDFGVGLLELVSELSRILSFAFRLFGNIFAGSVLLFVIGSLVPVFAQSGFLMLEFFVGVIQALVFGLLTMVFMSQATAGHGEHAEEHAA